MSNIDIRSRINSSLTNSHRRHLEVLGHGCCKSGSLYIGDGGEREFYYMYNGNNYIKIRKQPIVPVVYKQLQKEIYRPSNPEDLLAYVRANCLKHS